MGASGGEEPPAPGEPGRRRSVWEEGLRARWGINPGSGDLLACVNCFKVVLREGRVSCHRVFGNTRINSWFWEVGAVATVPGTAISGIFGALTAVGKLSVCKLSVFIKPQHRKFYRAGNPHMLLGFQKCLYYNC